MNDFAEQMIALFYGTLALCGCILTILGVAVIGMLIIRSARKNK